MVDPIAQFLAGYPPDIQAIFQNLRQVIMSSIPDAKEVLYASQNHFGYSLSGKRHELAIYLVPNNEKGELRT
jgi:urate oxidase